MQTKIRNSSIINIVSLAATLGFPDNPAYQASKSGDLGRFGIKVYSLSPDYIYTYMIKLAYLNPKNRNERFRKILIVRWGVAHDLWDAEVFLLSNIISYVTGADLIIDGGCTSKAL